jgi:hypothetical protein
MWDLFLLEMSKLSLVTGSVLVSFVAAIAAIVGALISTILSKLFLGARDKQDREAEWRKHAVELTKLDLDRKLKTRDSNDTTPIRPVILDFLANYRDLSELGDSSPGALYEKILTKRIKTSPSAVPVPNGATVAMPVPHQIVTMASTSIGEATALPTPPASSTRPALP